MRSAATQTQLAGWLLAQETGVDVADPPGLSAAAERVCQKLSRRLSRLVSPAGAQAILSRALHLARREFPFLEGVVAGQPPELCLEGLDERLHGVKSSDASAGVLALLGAMLDLLVGFIGEDLTVRLVREVWPDLPDQESARPGSNGREHN
jgi:hypothetical protein